MQQEARQVISQDKTTEPRAASPSAEKVLASLRGRATCSIEDAARLLGVGRSTAYAAARDGSLPSLRIAGRLLVPTAKLAAMLGIDRDVCDRDGRGH